MCMTPCPKTGWHFHINQCRISSISGIYLDRPPKSYCRWRGKTSQCVYRVVILYLKQIRIWMYINIRIWSPNNKSTICFWDISLNYFLILSRIYRDQRSSSSSSSLLALKGYHWKLRFTWGGHAFYQREIPPTKLPYHIFASKFIHNCHKLPQKIASS